MKVQQARLFENDALKDERLLSRRRYRVNAADWKIRGAVYTSEAVAAAMTKWALRSPDDHVLDPACGDGVFLTAAKNGLRSLGAKKPHVFGVDLDPVAARESGGINSDFFAWASSAPQFDVILGNPPFIRSHLFDEDSRQMAFGLMERDGLKPSRLMSSWAPFLAISCQLLRPGGRLGFVLPEELLQVGYAKELRTELLRRFNRVMVCFPPRDMFAEVQQSTVLLLCDQSEEGPRGLSVVPFDSLLSGNPRSLACPPWDWCEKWTHLYLTDGDRRLIVSGFAVLQWRSLATFGRVEVGIVTGSNRFFALSPERAETLGSRFLLPSVTSTRDLRGTKFTSNDFNTMLSASRPAYLFSSDVPEHELPKPVRAYVLEGERHGVHKQYKCKLRTPWYSVPSMRMSHAALFRQVGDFARLVHLEKPCAPTDTLHRVTWTDEKEGARLATAFLNTWTLLATELTGRSYGGGVLEIMPKEASRLLVPTPTKAVDAIEFEVDRLVRAKKTREAIARVDEVVLPPSLSKSKRVHASELLDRLIDRRKRA